MRALLSTARRPARHFLARFATVDSSVDKEILRVSAILADALEATKYIGESAQQAYLETEPSLRDIPESYTLRYLSFARDQVESALSQYEVLAKSIGAERLRELEGQHQNFGLVVADTLLARDKLRAQIRSDEARLETKQADGLKRADLTFCDGPA